MAYGDSYNIHYKAEWVNYHRDTEYVLYIREKDYDGPEIEVKASYPVVSYKTNGSDDIFHIIRGKTATINLIAEEGFELSTLYTPDDRTFLVEIWRSPPVEPREWEIEFKGWVLPFDAKEPFTQFPYEISFDAVCGLSTLKDMPFDNIPANAVLSVRQAISFALLYLGYDVATAYQVQTYEDAMIADNPEPGYPVFENICIQYDNWLDENAFPKSCYEVIENILHTYNCAIEQYDGCFYIWRIDEWPHLLNPSDGILRRYWRSYGSYFDTTGTLQIKPFVHRVEFNPHTTDDDRDSFGEAVPLLDEVSIEPATHKVTVVQSYGRKKNLLKNGFFRTLATYNTAGQGIHQFPDGWINNSDNGAAVYRLGAGTQEDPYYLELPGWTNAKPRRDDNVFVAQALPARTMRKGEQDMFTLTIRYQNINTKGLKAQVIAGDLGGITYCLQNDGSWAQIRGNQSFPLTTKTYSLYITSENIYPDGNNEKAKPTIGPIKFEITTTPLPKDLQGRPYTIGIRLYRGHELAGQDSSPAYIRYYSVNLTRRDANQVDIEKEVYIASQNNVERKRAEKEVLVTVGDQITARKIGESLREGAFLRLDGITPTVRHFSPIVTYNVPIAKLNAYGRLLMLGLPRRVFEGDLKLEPGRRIAPFDLIYIADLELYCLLTGWEWTPQPNTVRVRAVAVRASSLVDANVKAFYETSDGIRLPIAGENEDHIEPISFRPDDPNFGRIRDTVMQYLKTQRKFQARLEPMFVPEDSVKIRAAIIDSFGKIRGLK